MPLKRIGIGLWGGMNQKELVECIKLAEKNGFESAWMAEGHGGDAFSILSAAAVSTRKIKLGTSIVSVFVRSPPTIALGAATVDALSNKRFILGLGSSHKVQVKAEHGIQYEKPMDHIRETVEIVRKLFKDGKVSYKGSLHQIESYDLWFPAARKNLPIYLSAVFPKMLELTGQIADGLILVWQTPGSIKAAIQHVRDGIKKAGRKNSEVDITSLLPCSISKDAEGAKKGMKGLIAFYCGFFPRYNRVFAESGFAKEAAAIKEAWDRGDKEKAASLVTDEMVDEVAIAGTPNECIEKVEAYRKTGLSLPILFPTGAGGKVKEGVLTAIKTFSQ